MFAIPGIWIYVGLSAALYAAIKRHDPSFVVLFRKRDFALISAIVVLMIGAVYVYTRHALG